MGKKNKTAKKPTPTVNGKAVSVPLVEHTVKTDDVSVSSTEIVGKIHKLLVDDKASGYVIGVADSAGKIVPYAGAKSIGDLLTLKYSIEKEIEKLISKSTGV